MSARRESENPLYGVKEGEPSYADVTFKDKESAPQDLTYNALYSTSTSRVQFTGTSKTGTVDFASAASQQRAAPRWLFGIVTALAIVGVVLGVVAVVLVITKGNCSCNEVNAKVSTVSPPSQIALTAKQMLEERVMVIEKNITVIQNELQDSIETANSLNLEDINQLSEQVESGRTRILELERHLEGNISEANFNLSKLSLDLASLQSNLQLHEKDNKMLEVNQTRLSLEVNLLANSVTSSLAKNNNSNPAAIYYESCSDIFLHATSPISSGIYLLRDRDNNFFDVFCDSSDPSAVWTLIESFSLQNEVDSFSRRPFTSANTANSRSVNAMAYRISEDRVTDVKQRSTHLRATCNFFNNSSVKSYDPNAAMHNSAVISLVDLDPFQSPERAGCALTEYMDIESQSCSFCKAYWRQSAKDDHHLHYSPLIDRCTSENVGQDFNYWGSYSPNQSAGFPCTATLTSTTQFWLGRYGNRTCLDYLLRGKTQSGLYAVEDVYSKPYTVFCDFDSEEGAAWTLIEAFKRKDADGINPQSRFPPFNKDMEVSEGSPNLEYYRLSRTRMLSLRGSSTHWRATCGLKAGNLVVNYQDYARTRFANSNADILADPLPADGTMVQMSYIGLYGVSCNNCNVPWYFNARTTQHMHFNYDTSVGNGDLPVSPVPVTKSADSFGHYSNYDGQSSCANGESATTQWWIGGYKYQ
eukprot:m.107158 g.107158  ORF g.107158 m.107158 type:complete len:699 (+) comp37286_c0_seq1:288-2384(+)